MTWRTTFDALSTDDKVTAAILCAWRVATPSWRQWAREWLRDENRGHDAAATAYHLFAWNPVDTMATFAAFAGDPRRQAESALTALQRAQRIYGIDPGPTVDAVARRDPSCFVDGYLP